MKDCDIIKLIELHIDDTQIEKSCSFFGGYALVINGEIKLLPQCCALFEEINDWKKILNEDFDPFWLTDCHPSPKFTLKNSDVIIECKEDMTGPFIPQTNEIIKVKHRDLQVALKKLIEVLKEFSTRIDQYSKRFNSMNISKYLIWGDFESNL